MARAVLILAMLIGAAGIGRSTQQVYPPLTRETLVGTWEAVVGIGAHPVVFHVVITSRDADSYLSEIYPDSMRGRLFRLESCTVADGKVALHFRSTQPGDNFEWRIEGNGFGDEHHAWINSKLGYFEKGTWVRDLGKAASRAAEKIPQSPNAEK